MKKRVYESPLTTCVEVELESGILSGSVFLDKEDSKALTIDNQKLGSEFNFDDNLGNDDTWD